MPREIDFNLIRSGIVNAIRSDDYHSLQVFERTLSQLITQVKGILKRSLFQEACDRKLLRQAKRLYFMVISIKN